MEKLYKNGFGFLYLAQTGLRCFQNGMAMGAEAGWPFWILVVVGNCCAYAILSCFITLPAGLSVRARKAMETLRWTTVAIAVVFTISRLTIDLGVHPVQAAQNGDIQRLNGYAACGINLNQRDNEMTPLTAAIRAGQIETVKRLVVLGARINKRDGNHDTPLTVANETHETAIVEYLLQHGAKEDTE